MAIIYNLIYITLTFYMSYFMLNTLRNYETDHGCMFDCHKFPFNSDLINFMV